MDYELSSEEADLFARVDRISAEVLAPIAAEIEDEDVASPELLKALAETGVLGEPLPTRYGGSSGERHSAMKLCLVRQALARHCTLADELFVGHHLGLYPLLLSGTEEQRERLVGPAARGEALHAYALSEPDAGSDASAITARADRVNGGYVLHGTKRWITNAPDADHYVVFAKTDPDAGGRGVSAFLVSRGDPGFHPGPRLRMTAPHPLGDLRLDGCELPADRLLGAEGEGMRIALDTLYVFRPSVGAQAVGWAERAFSIARTHALRRRTFGQRLIDHQAIGFKLADMYTRIELAEGLVRKAAWTADRGEDPSGIGSMAKVYSTETAVDVVYEAQQILGAAGLLRDSMLERLSREAREATLYEGPSEIQRIIISRRLVSA
jgi:acyl-CoA dehydrogenase